MKTKIKSEQVHPAGAPGATFTPGPWNVYDNIGRKSELGIIAAAAPCIIAIMGNAKEWPAEAQANARLIALCPELLDAADHLLKEMRLAFNDVPAGVDAHMAILRGIVSKAKGQP